MSAVIKNASEGFRLWLPLQVIPVEPSSNPLVKGLEISSSLIGVSGQQVRPCGGPSKWSFLGDRDYNILLSSECAKQEPVIMTDIPFACNERNVCDLWMMLWFASMSLYLCSLSVITLLRAGC